MIRGIYTSASGMNVQMGQMDVISNNLSNISVPGFKKDRLVTEPFLKLLQLGIQQPDMKEETGNMVLGVANQGVAIEQVLADFTDGALRETDKNTNFALSKGFFTIADPDNMETSYYTRNGSFHVDSEGYLLDENGYYVMGENGSVQIENIDQFVVDEYGNITEDGMLVDKFNIVSFSNSNDLKRVGNNLFQAQELEPVPEEKPGLQQWFLESANVDLVEESANMINVTRAYETGQKIIQAHDGMLDMVINKVGATR